MRTLKSAEKEKKEEMKKKKEEEEEEEDTEEEPAEATALMTLRTGKRHKLEFMLRLWTNTCFCIMLMLVSSYSYLPL